MLEPVKNISRGLILISGLIWLGGCYYDNEETLYHRTIVNCNSISATFDANVQSIIISKCATSGCHDATGAGATVLLTYADVKRYSNRINQRTLIEKTMPPGGGMTQDELNILNCWISNGTPQ
jgi:uncharacterized membrane protein